jgi:hypothetical protein
MLSDLVVFGRQLRVGIQLAQEVGFIEWLNVVEIEIVL